ncbi:amino acid ABC transporter membrane protein 2 (PAAT family) [Isoptericola jiangsuensis]|uniref:Amino acid ABC transporter membrane protein 2 (PAAT family) n=1 Tax=Isoptericola jiangsuensis TaxID=548579 RepID=A0A2A9EV92_9MICO|nr:amino acid ABC transporter permease [Isoptericola jiangsuensis]PFG42808.1 amino acid ABC transporter membrane protein 2 (PAAT family) [Isoptericola jiangsuensis]
MSASVLFDAPGPRARRRILLGNVVGALVVAAGAAFVLTRLADKGQLDADLWLAAVDANAWTNYYIPGFLYTVRAAGAAIVGAGIFGLLFGLGRLASSRTVRIVCGAVVEFFRAVPVLLMMVFFWLLLANAGVPSPSYWGVVIALVLYNGSVVAELVRSGVHGLPRGQREAALSVGLTRGQSLRSVEVPQALVAMLPALVSQLVVVLKDSALGAIISYSELLQHARRLGSGEGNILQTLTVAALLFILINWGLTKLAERLSRTVRRTAGRTGTTAAGLDAGVGEGATAVAAEAPHGLTHGEGAGPGDPDRPARWD